MFTSRKSGRIAWYVTGFVSSRASRKLSSLRFDFQVSWRLLIKSASFDKICACIDAIDIWTCPQKGCGLNGKKARQCFAEAALAHCDWMQPSPTPFKDFVKSRQGPEWVCVDHENELQEAAGLLEDELRKWPEIPAVGMQFCQCRSVFSLPKRGTSDSASTI